MNILFIGKRFYTNRDALQERYGRIYQFPWNWSETGSKVELWLIDYHSKDNVKIKDNKLSVISTSIRRLSWVSKFIQVISTWRRHSQPDIIISSGDCYIGILGWVLARILRVQFVFDIYDKYDEFSGYRRLYLFDPFQFLLSHADKCIFASRPMLNLYSRNCKIGILAPNGIDTNKFHEMDKYDCRVRFGLPKDKLFVGYFGSLDEQRGIDDLVDAINLLRNNNENIELLVAGVLRPGLKFEQGGIRYLGNLPFDDVPSALACCDVLALPYRQSVYLDMASSCKIAEYISACRPIVATNTPNFVENFPQQSIRYNGLLANPSDPVDLASVVLKQLQNPENILKLSGIGWDNISMCIAEQLNIHSN